MQTPNSDTHPILSFEVFPPKKTDSLTTLTPAFASLAELSPDYISVTLGAGGNASLRQNTLFVADHLQNDHGIPAVAHLPAINFTKAEIREFLQALKQRGITRFLALRGDKCPNKTPKTDFTHASDLVEFVRGFGGFEISAACYPETHLEASSPADDIKHLKTKVDAGVDRLITQLFFDNDLFLNFVERARKAGIDTPIQAGIMPITNLRQIERISELTQVHIPKTLQQQLARYADDPVSLSAVGIDYAAQQIQTLLGHDIAGIHLYTMNNPAIAGAIQTATRHLFHPEQVA